MDDDEYICYGTPLPDIEDEVTLRKKAAKELEVCDENGRRRFHGAFTGGFSAGYYNTVGTKEGWAPSTFVSSRKKIADRLQQNPEDFMDAEDFSEFGIATKRIHTTSHFKDASVSSTKKPKVFNIDSVIPGDAPLRDFVRPVQESIGIQILKKLGWRQGQGIGPRVQHPLGKVYGCAPFPNATVSEEKGLTFAPQDTQFISFQFKDNLFGLGYSGLSKNSVLHERIDLFAPTATKSYLAKDKRKLTITGQAFGVGAFEEDDEDIYSKDDMTQYDFEDMAQPKGEDVHAGARAMAGKVGGPLEGFCLSSGAVPSKQHFPPPALPPRFKPTQQTPALPSEPRQSAAQRLQTNQFQKQVQAKSAALKEASAEHSKFRPFAYDEEKQSRYECYLRFRNAGVCPDVQLSSMTEWEKQQEGEEFAKASLLYKPLAKALGARFESHSQLSVEHEVMAALKQREKETPSIPKKTVGSKDRVVLPWIPLPLLCKRFNVPIPNTTTTSISSPASSKKSIFDHLSVGDVVSASSKNMKENAHSTQEIESGPLTEKITNKGDMPSSCSTLEQSAPVEIKKPPIDLFKEIFANSSSEEDEEEKELELSPKVSSSPEDESVPVKKAGFGVFANLDLDALNQRKSPKYSQQEKQVTDVGKEMDETPNEGFYGPELPPSLETAPVSLYEVPRKHTKHKSKHKHKHRKHKSEKKKKHSRKQFQVSSSSDEEALPIKIIETLKKLKQMKQ